MNNYERLALAQVLYPRLTIIRRRGWLAGFLCVLNLLFGFGLAESLPLRASSTRLLERDLILVSPAFFISLPLRAASCARLLENDLVLVNTPLGPSTPMHTQDSSRHFLRWNGGWPSPAVTMSSSLVGDPQRDESRFLYASRSPGSGKSPLGYIAPRYNSEFLCDFLSRWLRACKRTSSVLAGESYDLPGVGGVVNRLLSPLLAPLRAALRPLGLQPRALGSTLGALLLIRSLRPRLQLPLLRSTVSPLALARTRRDEKKSGDESLYPRQVTLGALTLSGYFASSG